MGFTNFIFHVNKIRCAQLKRFHTSTFCSVAEQGRERREAASDPDNDRQPGGASALLRLGLHRLHKDYAVRRQVRERLRLSDNRFLDSYLRILVTRI